MNDDIIIASMANKQPAKKQPAKKQAQKKAPEKKAVAKKQPAKKAVTKKQPAKKQAAKKQEKKSTKKTSSTTAEVGVSINVTPVPSGLANTANETAYKITEAAIKAIDTTIIRVQDVAKKTLRQRMLNWFKR